MTSITLVGAGGKMGCRLMDNLKNSDYDMRYVEISERGIENIAQRGLTITPLPEAVTDADVIILAVPDRGLGNVAAEVIPRIKNGAMVMLLDPAAAYAGELPQRGDISYFVTHPCHPPVFNEEIGEARRDFFGGILARQPIVCAIMQGSTSDYEKGERIAKAMFAPVTRAHHITVEQMAILEPAMAETVTAACITIIREAMQEAINRGVPSEAARDFILGHVNIPLAIVFGEIESPFSDGAKLIIEYGKEHIFQPDWKRVFEPESVREQVRTIVNGVSAER